MSEGDRPIPRPGFYQPNNQEELMGAILARIDERTRNTDRRVEDMQRTTEGRLTELARVTDGRMGEMAREVEALAKAVSEQYVGRQEFKNLAEKVALHQKILFGAIGLICLSVLGAIIGLVVQRGGH